MVLMDKAKIVTNGQRKNVRAWRLQTNGGAIVTARVLRINSRVCLVAMEKC